MDKEQERNRIIVDRGLAKGGLRIHGVNPALLVGKILREKIQDGHYWYMKGMGLGFYGLLDECRLNVHIVGTYLNVAKTKVCKFITLLFRLLQQDKIIPFDVVEWLIIGDHGYKYLTVLFMVYARLVWEDNVQLYKVLESKYSDYRRIRIINNGVVKLTYIDEIADMLLNTQENDFCGMTLPRLINRWVLEDSGKLEERESELMDEFEDELDAMDE